ncbi:STAS domain-containing protein [Streptomyces sp. NPDC059785]|uniref:STAS domain-containing protein n=1 Tax=Streptomyces sp. NPDC059785 TaxID=3346945 RepID=UPI003664C83F
MTVSGDIDLDAEAALQRTLGEALTRSARGVDVDLSGVGFCDCAGLNVLLRIRRRALTEGKTVTVPSAAPAVDRLLSLTGTRSLFGAATPDAGAGGGAGDGVPGNGVLNHSGPHNGVPDGRIPDQGGPDDPVADGRVPDHGGPHNGVPDGRIPDQGGPDDRVADARVPDHGGPRHGVPDYGDPDHGGLDGGVLDHDGPDGWVPDHDGPAPDDDGPDDHEDGPGGAGAGPAHGRAPDTSGPAAGGGVWGRRIVRFQAAAAAAGRPLRSLALLTERAGGGWTAAQG